MTSSQSFKIYDALMRHLNDAEDAKTIVTEIESIVETLIDNKKDVFLTKDDKIDLISQIKEAKVSTILWIVGLFIVQETTIIALFLKLSNH